MLATAMRNNIKGLPGAAAAIIIAVALVSPQAVGYERAEASTPSTSPYLVNQVQGYGAGMVALSPTEYLLGFIGGRRAAIIDPIDGREIIAATLPTSGCETYSPGCTFSKDGQLFAASVNNCVVVIDVFSETVLIKEAMPDTLWGIGALSFTPDSQNLLMGGDVRGVYKLDLSSRTLAHPQIPGGDVVGIQLMPDDSTAAIARFDGNVDLWAWRRGQLVGTLGGCEVYCPSLVVAGRYVLAGCGGHEIRVWDARTHEDLGVIRDYPFIGQQFSASGRTGLLLAGSQPGRPGDAEGSTTCTIVLIDIATGQLIKSWRSHTAQGIYDTAISEDGHLLVTCGYDGMINVWCRERE